jgi:glycosyl transferase family 87
MWDLRSLNCNMLYCVLLVLGLLALRNGWDITAGLALAASVALKLYPMLVVGYLLWIGRRRAFAATVGFLLVFFGLLPLVVFGPDSVVQAYASWISQLRTAATTLQESDHPILISIPFTLTKRLGADTVRVQVLTATAGLVWLAAVAACLFAKGWRKQVTNGWDLAVDGGVLVLTPVVISPYLEPYHVVPALLLALALMQQATHSAYGRKQQLGAAGALGLGWVALAVLARFDLTGVGVCAQMTVMVAALAILRRTTASPICPASRAQGSAGRVTASPPAAHSAPQASPRGAGPGDWPEPAACRRT